jgi:PilZ domain
MEHRLGTRHAIDLEVYLRTWGSRVSARGRLRDLSVSGAFVATQLPCRPLLHIAVQIVPVGQTRRNSLPAEGLIVRLGEDGIGIGIEWDELEPQLLSQLIPLQDAAEHSRSTANRYMQ